MIAGLAVSARVSDINGWDDFDYIRNLQLSGKYQEFAPSESSEENPLQPDLAIFKLIQNQLSMNHHDFIIWRVDTNTRRYVVFKENPKDWRECQWAHGVTFYARIQELHQEVRLDIVTTRNRKYIEELEKINDYIALAGDGTSSRIPSVTEALKEGTKQFVILERSMGNEVVYFKERPGLELPLRWDRTKDLQNWIPLRLQYAHLYDFPEEELKGKEKSKKTGLDIKNYLHITQKQIEEAEKKEHASVQDLLTSPRALNIAKKALESNNDKIIWDEDAKNPVGFRRFVIFNTYTDCVVELSSNHDQYSSIIEMVNSAHTFAKAWHTYKKGDLEADKKEEDAISV